MEKNLKHKVVNAGVVSLEIYKDYLIVNVDSPKDKIIKSTTYTDVYKALIDFHRSQNIFNGKLVRKASIELIEYNRGEIR